MGKAINKSDPVTGHKNLAYLKEDDLHELPLLMNDIDKMLTGLIKSLKK